MVLSLQATASMYGQAIKSEFETSQQHVSQIIQAKTASRKVVLSAAFMLRPIACALVILISLTVIAPFSLLARAFNLVSELDFDKDFKRVVTIALYHGLVINPVAILVQPFGFLAGVGKELIQHVQYNHAQTLITKG